MNRFKDQNVNDNTITKDASVASIGNYIINGIRIMDNNIKIINNSFCRVYNKPNNYSG